MQAHGRFAEDLPFMGKDLTGDAADARSDDSGSEQGGRGGLGRSSALSQEMPPAAVCIAVVIVPLFDCRPI